MKRLVILAPNWLGDAVMALPAIADVRRVAADAHITVAARPAIAPLFALVPAVNDTIVLERQASVGRVSTWRTLGAELAAGDFDTALLLPNSIHAALVASRAGIPARWGYRASWRSSLLTRAIDPPSGLHQVEYYQQLVHALGFPNGPIEPRVVVPDAARHAGAVALTEAGWADAALVAIAPGAAYGGAKRWPPRSFAEVADALAADGVQSVLIGSAADAQTGREVLARVTRRDAVLNLIGRTDLVTLAGVMTRCRALITNDSGAMHLGAAVGVRVTAVFGPTDERATRPLGDAHTIVTHDVWCRPCMLRECPLDHQCMRGVTADAVLLAARRLS
jgi:lipopolysaccharide heptosyltransferase II